MKPRRPPVSVMPCLAKKDDILCNCNRYTVNALNHPDSRSSKWGLKKKHPVKLSKRMNLCSRESNRFRIFLSQWETGHQSRQLERLCWTENLEWKRQNRHCCEWRKKSLDSVPTCVEHTLSLHTENKTSGVECMKRIDLGQPLRIRCASQGNTTHCYPPMLCMHRDSFCSISTVL